MSNPIVPARSEDRRNYENERAARANHVELHDTKEIPMPKPLFEKFSRLPIELRLKIWQFSPPRRVLAIKIAKEEYRKDGRLINSKLLAYCTPHKVPAILHVCRESRREAQKLYNLTSFFCRMGKLQRGERYFASGFDTIALGLNQTGVTQGWITPSIFALERLLETEKVEIITSLAFGYNLAKTLADGFRASESERRRLIEMAGRFKYLKDVFVVKNTTIFEETECLEILPRRFADDEMKKKTRRKMKREMKKLFGIKVMTGDIRKIDA